MFRAVHLKGKKFCGLACVTERLRKQTDWKMTNGFLLAVAHVIKDRKFKSHGW